MSGPKFNKSKCIFFGRDGVTNVFDKKIYKLVIAKLHNASKDHNIIKKGKPTKKTVLETTTENKELYKEWLKKIKHINIQFITDSFDLVRGLPKLNTKKLDHEACRL
ncbi:hypothetical protein NPIL_647591 [Nephila pilipes]|uniref:Uncharacterized protein n=1 Tax=Nephila pilipes TaxID=299642 RepID=A0A8X6QK19_NEPPI|nr:hypothetical protein NPIL_647591 [Nephila pilipes]